MSVTPPRADHPFARRPLRRQALRRRARRRRRRRGGRRRRRLAVACADEPVTAARPAAPAPAARPGDLDAQKAPTPPGGETPGSGRCTTKGSA
jgi:hypothetical protein